jgi:hypothetical protein
MVKVSTFWFIYVILIYWLSGLGLSGRPRHRHIDRVGFLWHFFGYCGGQ